ncbi:hypothetical protein BDN67DRAFT_983792 [Paxillus ammoniavirescens]|nr:hypothetical protein BDN67DRAFT_983792 [Paxillus ammoniavirescens]
MPASHINHSHSVQHYLNTTPPSWVEEYLATLLPSAQRNVTSYGHGDDFKLFYEPNDEVAEHYALMNLKSCYNHALFNPLVAPSTVDTQMVLSESASTSAIVATLSTPAIAATEAIISVQSIPADLHATQIGTMASMALCNTKAATQSMSKDNQGRQSGGGSQCT